MDMSNTEKEIKYRRKPKAIFFRFIFSRFFLILLSLLLEILFILFWFGHISSDWSMVSILLYDLLCIVILLNTNWQKNEYKFLWITILVILPGAGAIFYLTYRIIQRFSFAKRKSDKIRDEIKFYDIDNYNYFKDNLPIEEFNSFFYYLYNKERFFPMINNKIVYYDKGNDFFDKIKIDLLNAKKTIFIEFFIISNGLLWIDISNIFIKKAIEGIDIKIMYDGLNITNDFSIKEVNRLKKYNIDVKMFAPIVPLVSSKQNNRDHRKIVVIDDNIAYTGGFNIGDEYVNYYKKYGIWKDSGVRVEGDLAKSFKLLFLQVWMMTVDKNNRDFTKYLPYHILNDKNEYIENDNQFSYCVAYTDFPNDKENVSEDLYSMMIDYSYKYLYIMTPYLILSEGILDSLIRAKKRGVDVRIILPHIPDKPLVFYVSRSYYKILLENGIKCYEYKNGFVHSKVFCQDDKRAIVGTANFDYRSLFLHYEDGLYIYNDKSIIDIKNDFDNLFNDCIEFKSFKEIPLFHRLLGSILKVFAPQF